jgi:hypothetical protein
MLSDVLIGGGLDIIETLDFVLRHRFGEIIYGRRGVDLGIQMADCLEKLILVERFASMVTIASPKISSPELLLHHINGCYMLRRSMSTVEWAWKERAESPARG